MSTILNINAQEHHQQVEVKQTKLYIDGQFVQSANGKTFQTLSPVTEQVIADIALADKEDVDKAVLAAKKALTSGPWVTMSARDRGHLLYRLADLIEKNVDELARLEVLDTGKPINDAKAYDIPGSAKTLRYFAGWADKIQGQTIPIDGDFFTHTRKEPVGVCGLIIPWNYPLSMAAWKLGPSLAAGCTVLLKPAEQSPLTALRLAELVEEAGFPKGVVNILPGFGAGGAGEAMVAHPGIDKIAFTGEGATATVIKRQTADSFKRLSFELGGKSPNIILEDADLTKAIPGSIGAIFANQGQNCCAGSRTYVQRKVYQAFIEGFVELAKERRIGCPFKASTEHGSQIDKAQFDKIMYYINEGKNQGANVLAGGHQVGEQGYFIAPTVFADVTDKMKIAQDEIFGPVASLIPFDSIDEVIERANNTRYGLASAVWTQDIDKANVFASQLKAGTVWVNCYNIVDPGAPFGGYKASGIGRELSGEALNLYLETKTVTTYRG